MSLGCVPAPALFPTGRIHIFLRLWHAFNGTCAHMTGRLTVTAAADALDSASPMSVSEFSSSSERQLGSPLSKASSSTPRGQTASHKTAASLQASLKHDQ